MQTNLTAIAKAYFGSAAFFTIAGEGLMYLSARAHWLNNPDYLLPVIGSFSVPALPFGFYLAARVARLTQPPARPGPRWPMATSTLASLAPWFVPPQTPRGTAWGLEHPEELTGKPIRYPREPNRVEFVFYEPGMRSQISESRLYDFCKIAWRRQQQVHFGGLASNRVMSREYFTKEARPRFPMPAYQSCIYILDTRRLIINRYKGGELFYTPGITVEEAMKRWIHPP
jgi:hypothetical protein